MSNEPTPTPDAISPTPASTKASQPVRSRREKWRRRFFITIAALLLVALSFRLVLHALFPYVLDRVARGYGLSATYDKLDLQMLGGDVGMWGLRFTPVEGGEPAIRSSYCRGAISIWRLFRLQLHVERVEAEDAEVVLQRLPDGTMPLVEKLLAATSTNPTAPTASAASTSTEPMSLDAPLRIDTLRLQNARARFRDGMTVPETDVTLQLDLMVRDVASTQRPTRVEIQLHSPEALAALYVDSTIQTRPRQLDADVSVKMVGLDLTAARAYLEPLGLVPTANNLSAQATGKVSLALVPLNATTTQATSAPADPSTPLKLAGALSLDDIWLSANSVEAAGMKRLRVEADEISPGAIRIARVEVDDVFVHADRNTEGLLSFAGIELGTAAPQSPTTKPTPTTRPGATAPLWPVVELRQLDVRQVRLQFDDRALSPANVVSLAIPAITVRNFTTDPRAGDAVARLTLRATAEALAKEIEVDGSFGRIGEARGGAFEVQVRGISATALAPYLTPVGITPTFQDGSLATSVEFRLDDAADTGAAWTMYATKTKISDGSTLFEMPRVAVESFRVDALSGGVAVRSIEINGPVIPISRRRDGSVHALGFAWTPHSAASVEGVSTPLASTRSAASTAPSIASSGLRIPNVSIDAFKWSGARLQLRDEMPDVPVALAIEEVEVSLKNLHVGDVTSAVPAELTASLKTPGMIDRVMLNGVVDATDQRVSGVLRAQGQGITFHAVESVLGALGIKSTYEAGSLDGRLQFTVESPGDRLRADLTVSDVVLKDHDEVLASLRHLNVVNCQLDGHAITIDDLSIESPYVFIDRDDIGQPMAGGFRLLREPEVHEVVGPTPSQEVPTRLDLHLPYEVTLRRFVLSDGSLRWRDTSVLPAVDIRATFKGQVEGMVVGMDAKPARFLFEANAPGVVESAIVDGNISLAPSAQRIEASLKATGLGLAPIAGYLPPNIGLDFSGRAASGRLTAALSHHPSGGSELSAELSGVSLGSDSQTDVGLKTGRLTVSRIDLPGKVIRIDEAIVEGATLHVRHDDAGLHVAGVTIAPQNLRPVVPQPSEVEPVVGGAVSDVDAIRRDAREQPPLVSVARLSLGLERASFASGQLGQPLVLSDWSVRNTARIEIGGPDPSEHGPIDLAATGRVEDLIDTIEASLSASLFATEPSARATLAMKSIQGTSLTKFIPATAQLLDGADLDGASFQGAADARFKFARRGALGIDLSREISADVVVSDVYLRSPSVERPLFGVAAVRGDKIRFIPASGSLLVGTVEIEKPTATVVRDVKGVHVAGVTFKVLQPASAAETADRTSLGTASPEAMTIQPTTATEEIEPAAPSVSVASDSGAEIRVDRLMVSGVDFLIEDRVNQPATSVPITELDVEVTGLTSLALTETRPVRFSAVASSGKVPLPPRKAGASSELESRPVFAEASANGNLTLFPKPKGYVRASLSGLEMTAIRGVASEFGITLGGGTFDSRVDVRMQGADTFEAKVWPTFNELRMSEVPDGPVQSVFRLPAPPDVVIATVEDVDGSLTFPLTVPIEAGNVKVGPIVASAVASISKVLAEAMVAASLKAAKLAGGLFGADMSSDRLKGSISRELIFTPGETQLSGEQLAVLEEIRQLMRRDATLEVTLQHELGELDITRAGERINPSRTDIEDLADQLRQQKRDLQRRVADAWAALRVADATGGASSTSPAASELRDVSAELKHTEDRLDEVLELLSKASESRANRRTKSASILLAELRLRSVQEWLLASELRDVANRVRKGNATAKPSEQQEGRVRLVMTRRAKS
jgi:Domain of Unknown Function (DUF748)